MEIMKHDHRRRQITKKKYGMKELCMWKNSIPIFYEEKVLWYNEETETVFQVK